MSNISTISNHFANPKVSDFLSQQLGLKKGEFVSNVIALTESDKALQNCNPAELMKCAMNATALNLPLNKNLGYAYVIPYGNKPQFQIGYKGFIQLAIRSGQYKTINSVEVREGEIKRNKFTGYIDFLSDNEDRDVVGYLGYIEMLNGFQQSLYMTIEQVESHAKKYSKSYAKYGSGLWKDEFDTMAKKTVIKLLLSRYGALSTEMQKALISDQSDSKGNYMDNSKDRSISDAEIIEQEDTGEVVKKINLSDI